MYRVAKLGENFALIGIATDIYAVSKLIAAMNWFAATGLIGLFILFIRSIPGFSTEQVVEIVTYIPALVYLLITLVLIISNVYCAFRLWNSHKNNVRKLILISLVPLFVTIWPLTFFIFFINPFVPEFIPLLLSLIIALFFLAVLWLQFKKLSVLLFFVTVFIAGYAFLSRFEENYCSRLADQEADKDVYYYDLSEPEKNFMGGGSSGPNRAITGWARAHIKCHESFNFASALTDSLTHMPSVGIGIPQPVTIDQIVEDKPRDKIIEYQVAETDDLNIIAEKFGISVNTIKWANSLTDHTIRPGQILKILPITGVMHQVLQGETIDTIANKYKTNAQKIIDFPFNLFSDDKYTLTPGQTIVVPDGIKN